MLHSYAFRRLADKTQVVVPGEDDFPRTRLTHSLEVAQIGREIGAALGCDPDIVDAAGLAHDIGHPPFGHNGEEALDAVADACGGFEGNAQTLRILTRLEAEDRWSVRGEPAGLNLTRAVLDATCKYPWPRSATSGRKYGVLRGRRSRRSTGSARGAPDEPTLPGGAGDGLGRRRRLLGARRRGRRARGPDPAGRRRRRMAREAVCADRGRSSTRAHDADELARVLDELLDLPTLRDLAGYDGSYLAQAAAKRATSELTGRFAGAAIHATRARYGDGPLTRYDADLVVPAGDRGRVRAAQGPGRALRHAAARVRANGRRAERQLLDRAGRAGRGGRAGDARPGPWRPPGSRRRPTPIGCAW